jgi:hypothetical protein
MSDKLPACRVTDRDLLRSGKLAACRTQGSWWANVFTKSRGRIDKGDFFRPRLPGLQSSIFVFLALVGVLSIAALRICAESLPVKTYTTADGLSRPSLSEKALVPSRGIAD